MTTDVIISGAGPNGLLMACELAKAGIQPVVLEALPERPDTPKANGLVGRVVQAMDYRGLHERFTGSARPPAKMPGFQFGALPLALDLLADHAMYVLPIPQRTLEAHLTDHAAELGVTVRRRHEVTDVRQDADQVTVDVTGPDGPYSLSARYLVGADGGHSVVRKRCGIGFPGFTDVGFVGRTAQVGIDASVADQRTGELTVPGAGTYRPATFTRTEGGMLAYGMFTPGVFRIAVYEWVPADESVEITLGELQDAVDRVLGGHVPLTEPPGGLPMALRRTTDSNTRQADRYRAGRVFLVGDAAHVQTGTGGPGLNLGMQDVLNLGWKLAGALHGWAPESLVDTYESERWPVAARVQTQTRAQTALLGPGPNITGLREIVTELLRDEPAVQRIADLMSGADTVYPAPGCDHPLAGRWMPDLPLRTHGRVAELMRAARPVLLDLTGELAEAARPWADRVDVVTDIADTTDAPPADAVLIRPDGYVAWAGADTGELRRALETWFGRALTVAAN